MRHVNFWNGRCPECELKEKTSRMRLNRDDFFECEHCRLQMVLTALGVMATILVFRGQGRFRTHPDYADDHLRNELLSPQTRNEMPFTRNEIFNSNQQIIDYLKQKVDPVESNQTI